MCQVSYRETKDIPEEKLPLLQRNMWGIGNLKCGEKFYSAMQGGLQVDLKLKLHIQGSIIGQVGERAKLLVWVSPGPCWQMEEKRGLSPSLLDMLTQLLLKEQMTWAKWADPKKAIEGNPAGNPVYLHCFFISAVYLMSFPHPWT